MQRAVLTFSAALMVGLSAACADGMPSAPAPQPVPCCITVATPNWSGVYIGLHGGARWGSTDLTFPFVENFNTASGQNFSSSQNQGVFGGHIGANLQISRILIGAEASYDYVGRGRAITGPVAAFPVDRFALDTKDLLTITGRIGFAHDKFLLYTKAGYANSFVEVSAISSTGVTARATERESGWIVGAGLETRLLSDILLGVEYNYLSLPSDRFSTLTGGTTGGLPFHADIDVPHMHLVMARLSILFGPYACCHDGLLGRY